MKCYEHAKSGETKDAVAVCANCGVGLCMDHLIEEVSRIPRTNEESRAILCHVCAHETKAKSK
jgi:hypothetical protein